MDLLKRLSPAGWIIGFSLLVHLPGITSPLLDYQAYRQTQTASMSRNYVLHGMNFLQPMLDTEGRPTRAGTEFPIYSYLVAIFYQLFGVREIWGRILSAVFAAWGALFLFRFALPRVGDRAALFGALGMCALPIHLFFTRTFQPESMALWGLLGFLYYTDRWLNQGGDWRDLILGTLIGAIAPLLKLPFLYLIGPLWLFLAWEARRWKLIKSPAMLAQLAMILLLTAAWYRYARTAPVGVLPLTHAEHMANLRPILSWNLWHAHFISRLPELCLTYSGVVFAGAGVYFLYKEGLWHFWAAWFAATALYIVLLGQYGVTHRYTALPFAPVCAVFIGSGIFFLWERFRHSRALKTTFIILMVGIPLHAGLRIKHWYEWEYPWVFEARKTVDQLAASPEELLITNTREHPVLLYHLHRYGFAPELEETGLGVLKTYRAQGIRLFLTPTEESWARNPGWGSYFEKNAKLIHQDPHYLIYRFNER